MASNGIRIPVSAEIQADHKSLLAVQKALENTLALAGKDTTFATNLRKSLAEIEPLIEKFGRIVMEPEIDKNALRELEHIAKKVFGTFDKTVEQGRFLDVSKMLSDEDLARIQEYTKQVAALGRELEKVRQHGAGGAASEWLAKPEVTKGSNIAARAAKSSTYKPAATLEQNVTSFTNAASAAAAKSADLAQRVVELASAYETATKAATQAQANLKTLEASVPAIQRRADTATFASAITRIKGTTSAAQNMQANTPIKEIGTTLHQFGDAGYIQASYRNLATRFFQALGMGIEQATSLAASQIDRDIVPALQRHFGIDETNMRSYVVDNGPMLSQLRAAGAIFGEILRNELAQARAAGMGGDVEGITDYAKKKQGELASARSAVKKARTAENEAFEEWSGAEEAQKQAEDLNIELTSLATALREAAAAAKTLKEAQLKADQDAAKRSATDAEDKERERVMTPIKTHAPQAQKDEKAGDENLGNMGDLLRQGENAKAEADAFKASMQNAIKQWFSVQQIINIVKQGIRQAYQDIQGLDKAMTNIAVVTDMSVSDLWGKINEYMSIAQQYGVTTQGVYEVSQLYYQQGLTTNEVMAATTETLKLARIAGMGYAEAADAMTVAIRSFKMEMSDAATVTDVYSKVAAITASDSEELAIAMSKTASSAESVGSSFENTTAMLAVMIETTRESAQNLGSALKSIISRYGEMKVGLTVDSEGEDIDYNKVDTALKSVGISIKDAQGQFRDFDDVIFELSEKWDSLDKNTQRYIATIMAGNRQQSRFIALVDNWERLDEVAGAAHNAEDAGLLQYAKTLDSLETKINNIKTSFQQFYMNIINGPAIGAALDFINKLIQGFNKLGTLQSLLNIVGLINGLKTSLSLVGQLFAKLFGGVVMDWRKSQEQMIAEAFEFGKRRKEAELRGEEAAEGKDIKPPAGTENKNGQYGKGIFSWGNEKSAKVGRAIGAGASVVGTALTGWGASMTANTQEGRNLWRGAAVSAGGNALQGVSMGATFGPVGMVIGGIVGALSGLPGIIKSLDKNVQLQHDYEKAKEQAETKKIEKAEKAEEYSSLESQLNNIKKLEEKKDLSDEDYNTWAEANNALVEKYPQLFGYMDQYGNKIADLTGSSDLLKDTFIQMAKAAKAANDAEIARVEAEINQIKDTEYEQVSHKDYAANTAMASGIGAGAGAATATAAGAAATAIAAKTGATIGTAAWPGIGTLVGTIIGLITGVALTAYNSADEKSTIDDRKFARERISTKKSEDFTNEELANYITKNKINLNELITKGKNGELTGDELSLYSVMKNYGIIDEHNNLIESFNKYWTGYKQILEAQRETIGRQNASLQVSVNAMETAVDDNIEDISGYSDIVINMGLSYGYTMERLANLSLDEYESLIKPFNDLYNELSTLKKEQFNSLYENLLSFSFDELVEQLTSLGITQGSSIFAAYTKAWVEQTLETRQRLFNTIFAPTFDESLNPTEAGLRTTYRNKQMELMSFSEWKTAQEKVGKTFASTDEAQQAYEKFLDKQITHLYKRSEEELAGEIKWLDTLYQTIFDDDSGELKISTAEAQTLTDFNSKQNDIIETSTSVFAQAAAKHRLEILSGIFGDMAVIDFTDSSWRDTIKDVGSKYGINLRGLGFDFSTWSAEDAQALQNLLLADNAGSMEWQEQIDALAAEYGQTINWSNENLEKILYTNLNTRISLLSEDIASFINEMEDLSKKQSNGFSWEESQKLLQQLGEGYSWSDVFGINEQGLIVLKNFDETLARLYGDKAKEFDELTREIEEAKSTNVFNSLNESYKKYFEDGKLTEEEASEWIKELEELGIDETVGQHLIDTIISNGRMTVEEYNKFLEELAQQNAELAAYFKQQQRNIQANAAFNTWFSNTYDSATTARTAAGAPSLNAIKDAAIANGAIKGTPVYKTDANGNPTGKVDYITYDWDAFFSNTFQGLDINRYGEAIIADPLLYAQSLVETLGETDQAIINDIYQSVFEQYHIHWQQRQAEMETFFADNQYTGEEVAKMFAWATSTGMAYGDVTLDQFAEGWDLKEIDGIWQATSEESYYRILAYAAAENPDLDFSDLPTWDEWAAQMAENVVREKEEAYEFLYNLGMDMGPDSLSKAIELGILEASDINADDLEAYERGNIDFVTLLQKSLPSDSDYRAALTIGLENYKQEVAKWLDGLFTKTTFTPEDLLELYKELAPVDLTYDQWLKNLITEDKFLAYDSVTNTYKANAGFYDVIAAAGKKKGMTSFGVSRVDYARTLRKESKTTRDAQISFLGSLDSGATIHDLDEAYTNGLLTEKQYLEAIIEVETRNKTYYQTIIDNIDKTDVEMQRAIQEAEGKRVSEALSALDNLFSSSGISTDIISQMYADANTNKDMLSWAEDILGIAYKNGQWVIENVNRAYQAMESWFKQEYGNDYEKYMPSQTAFHAIWANAQDVKDESIISFLEGISPESSEEILTEAVELGIATWEAIASYKQKGYSAFDTIRAIVNKGKNTEQQTALRKSYQQYQQETMDTVEALFTDGLFSQEDLEGLWLASGTGATFDQWISEQTFFEKVGNDWVIKSREAYDEMVQWIADTYGPAFVAAIPSYEKLEAMGMLAEETRKEDQLGYLRGLVPDSMEIADLEKAVELGIISEGEMLAAVKNDADYWSIIKAAVGRMDAETQKAFAEARASYITNLMDEAEAWVETTTWTAEQLFEVYGGSDSWMTSGDYTLDLDTGEWKAITETGYQALVDHVSTMYHGAYDALMPTYPELQAQYGFKNLVSEGDKVDIIKGLSYDVSLDDLEKLAEAGMITYQQAMEIWNSNNPWAALQDAIVLTSEEQLAAYNQMVVENNIAMGEAAQAFFDDSTLTWSEVTTLWTSQLGQTTSENNVVRWAQTAGLEYIDGEWKITSEQAYNNMVAAAKELYGDAWAAMIPTKEDILAQNLLGEQIARDSKVSFIEGLDLDKITASDMQKAIEEGIITSEQLLWADTYGISYEKLLRMAVSSNAEMTQAFNQVVVEEQLNQIASMENFFDDNVLSQEEIMAMWEAKRTAGQSFWDWIAENGFTFEDGQFKMASVAAFDVAKSYAQSLGFDYSFDYSSWEAALNKIEDFEVESFFAGLDANAGMQEAEKAVELGILTREELLDGLDKGFDIWEIITGYVHKQADKYWEFLNPLLAQIEASKLESLENLFADNSFTMDELAEIFRVSGTSGYFDDWVKNFHLEDGVWKANDIADVQGAFVNYVVNEFGEGYRSIAEKILNELKAAEGLSNAIENENIIEFIEGLTNEADLDTINQAIELGIITAKDWEAAGKPTDSKGILNLISKNLATEEEANAFARAMQLIQAEKAKTVSELLVDNSFTAEEIFDIWQASGSELSFDKWTSQKGFVLQADGTYKAAFAAAYEDMRAYVAQKFGNEFIALLPTREQWETALALEGATNADTAKAFIESISYDATLDDLNEAATLLGLNFTEQQINSVLSGTITAYELILEEMSKYAAINGRDINGPYAEIAAAIKLATRENVIGKLSFGQQIATPEDYNETKQLLEAIAYDVQVGENTIKDVVVAVNGEYKTVENILEDGIIGLDETVAILKSSGYYDSEADNLLAVAEAYGVSLSSFFEMAVVSPAKVLEKLGLELSELTADQYDTYIAVQQTYQETIFKLFQGTGTAKGAEKLIATLNQNGGDWAYDDFIVTAEGIQLDRSKFFQAMATLRENDYQLYASIRETMVTSPEILDASFQDITDVLAAIADVQEGIRKNIDGQNEALEEQASIYGEIYARMSMVHSEGWDFLNRELHGNAQNFQDWAGSVVSSFQQINSSEGIDPTQFINMLTYMQQMDTDIKALGENFTSWGDLMVKAYSALSKATLTGSNIFTTDLGISTQDMSSAMFEAVQKMAKSQIEFLDGQIALLEGIQALQKVEGDIDLTGIQKIMAQAVAEYNAEAGASLKLEDFTFTINGEKYSFAELAEAEKVWDELYAGTDYAGKFAAHLYDSLVKNFQQAAQGQTIEVSPYGEVALTLSTDASGIVGAIDTSNNHLAIIQSSLQGILSFLTTGQNPWTLEGGEAYLRAMGMPDGGRKLDHWKERLDPYSRAIYDNYLKLGSSEDSYYAAHPPTLGERSNDYITLNSLEGQADTTHRAWKVVATGQGHAYRYATGNYTDTNGNGRADEGEVEYLELPKDYEEQVAAFRALENLPEEVSKFIKGISYSGVERTVDDNGNVVWVNKQTRKSVEPAYGGNLEQAYQSALNFISGENGSTYAQALFWAIMDQPEKIPGYGKGVKNSSKITDPSSATVNVTSLLSTTNTTLDTIQANTAETNALLAVIASGKSLDTKEGKRAYLKAMGYGRENNDSIQMVDASGNKITPLPIFNPTQWLSEQSDFTRQMWLEAYGRDASGNWTPQAASVMAQDAWLTNGLPTDESSIEDITAAFKEAFVAKDGSLKGTAPDWVKNFWNEGKGIIQPITKWSETSGYADFINWLAGTEYAQTTYGKTESPSDARKLSSAEIAARDAWLFPEGVDGVQTLPIGYGFLENDEARANWLKTFIPKNELGKYFTTNDETGQYTWNKDNLAKLYGTEGFETAFALKSGEFYNAYIDVIKDHFNAREAVKGYERTLGENGVVTYTNTSSGTTVAPDSEEYQKLNSAYGIIDNFSQVMTLYSSMLGTTFNPEMFLSAIEGDAILRSAEDIENAADRLVTATENLNNATGDLDTSVLRLSQALLASGLLPTYAGINPTELSTWDNAVFNIPGLDETVSPELFDTEEILANFATHYATAESPEVAEGIVADMRSWNGLMREAYNLMSSISGNVLRAEDANKSTSDVQKTETYQAMEATQGELTSVEASIATKENEVDALRTSISTNSDVLEITRSNLASVQAAITAANAVLDDPDSTVQEREQALADIIGLQGQEAKLLARESELMRTIESDRMTLANTEEKLTNLYGQQADLLTTLSTQQAAVAQLYVQEGEDWNNYIENLNSVISTLEELETIYLETTGEVPEWLTDLKNKYIAELSRASQVVETVTAEETEYSTAAGDSSSRAEDARTKENREYVIPDSPGVSSTTTVGRVGYVDTDQEIIAEYQAIIDELIANKNYTAAGEAITRYSQGAYGQFFAGQKVQWDKYQEAKAFYDSGDYANAYAILDELGTFMDSPSRSQAIKYEHANNLMENGQFQEAINLFKGLGDYSDAVDKAKEAQYAYAESLIKSNPSKAVELFEELGDYKDATDKTKEAAAAHQAFLQPYQTLLSTIENHEWFRADLYAGGLWGNLVSLLENAQTGDPQSDIDLENFKNAYTYIANLYENRNLSGEVALPTDKSGLSTIYDNLVALGVTIPEAYKTELDAYFSSETNTVSQDDAARKYLRFILDGLYDELGNDPTGKTPHPTTFFSREEPVVEEPTVEEPTEAADKPAETETLTLNALTSEDTLTIEFIPPEEFVVEEPVVEEPPVEEPVVEEPVVEKSVVEEPSATTDESTEAETLTLESLMSEDTLTIEFIPVEESPTEEVAAEESEDTLSPEFVEAVIGVEPPTPYEAHPVNLADTAEKIASAGNEFVETVIGAEPHTPYEAYPVNLADTADEVTLAGNEFVETMIGIEPPAKRLADNLGTAAGYVDSFASTAGGAIGALRMIINSQATIPSPSSKIGGTGFVAGSVSGLALAEGNTSLDRLNLGARLAGKTLVGELGPELAVYDGMYHLLGQNGAEFVDMPSDAIVFNHRQTAGIIRGQVGYRGTALAEGNIDDLEGAAFAGGHITGPARAGIDQTISQLKSLRAMWQNILDMDASQLAQAGGGGGGGNSLKATTADLEEWYNLMRQIEQIEQEINNLEAKRANIYDGSDYLKNLRETQKLLEKQRLTQQRLYEYQQKQLQAQADFINQHEIWSKFLTVGEDGLLQYIKGNEQVGGKGAIEVLQKLNEMSGAEQEKFVKSLGYTAKDEEGKALEGEKLVARFYEELQDQIDQYDELYDTVHATSAELEELTSQIEEANKEIAENQKELETNIYDIVVNAWEKEIELLEEQAKLVEETNKAYTDGLKKALDAERDLYEENKSTEERESLQRQLALLRRSGGSAAEIADLEEQLDDALKDEYFKTQEKMIENIEDANERQVKKLEEQITLQKEALEYEKDNGIIWTKVYDVLRGSQESILAFMQGNSTEFFTKSALEQEEMLLDWAKKIGIYSEDQQYKTAMAEAEKHWNSEAMWGGEVLNGLQGNYESLSDEQKADMAEYFKKSYSDARLDGSTEAEAQRIAEENIKRYLTEGGTGTGIGDMGGGSSGGDLTHWTFKFNGQDYYHYATQATATNKIDELYKSALENLPSKQDIQVPITPEDTAETIREKREKAHMERVLAVKKLRTDAISSLKYGSHAKGYSTGGLVDYTGIAVVHGSKSKPESFLSAEQTAQIKEALQATNGKSNLLESLYSTVDKLRSLVHSFSNINNSKNYDISIAPGAVVINVDELANSYDVEELSNDIMNRMATIASKATNRGVSRR